MTTLLWLLLGAIAVLWPGRLAGPLDGIPLDQPAEVVGIALLVWAVSCDRRVLRRREIRGLIVVLLAWKAVTATVATQDGWCARFVSPQSLYRDDVFVPHSWDVRADWRETTPRCSAIMTRDYAELQRFPVWFFNLPPADTGSANAAPEQPPNVNISLQLTGYLRADAGGKLQVMTGEDVNVSGFVAGRKVTGDELAAGVTVGPGVHDVRLDTRLTKSRWSLAVRWNDRPLWTRGLATMAPPDAMEQWLRPWGNWVSALLSLALFAFCIGHVARHLASLKWRAAMAAVAVTLLLIGSLAPEGLMRMAPLLLLVYTVVPPPRRLQTLPGALLLIGLPWLMLWLPRAAMQAGLFTWYSPGDDWWMFQRFAYRIFLQGYWLQGGEVTATFWFQPLYRWIAGSLHMVFGDSSAGELLLDVGAALAGAMFAFHVVRVFSGFRWATVAAAVVLGTFTLGPAWYLIGRGLSEFSSAGFLYAAALLSLRARHGHWPSAVAAGVLATLATFTRLNNLPMAIAVVMFAWPPDLQAGSLLRPSSWLRGFSRTSAAGVLGILAIGLWLFTARTYYYTRVPSMLHGTTAYLNSVWSGPGGTLDAIGRVLSSLAMLVTMNDPPRFDLRAVPLILGVIASIGGLLGVARLRSVPLGVSVFCLAGLAGGFVARGTAYPGRFSVHLVPAAVAVACCASAALLGRRRPHAIDVALQGAVVSSEGQARRRRDATGIE